mgnify:CR=1 FL=1
MALDLNSTIKQAAKRKAVPFEVSNQLYSEQLENALKESKTIEKEYKVGKIIGYNNAAEIVRTILNL